MIMEREFSKIIIETFWNGKNSMNMQLMSEFIWKYKYETFLEYNYIISIWKRVLKNFW